MWMTQGISRAKVGSSCICRSSARKGENPLSELEFGSTYTYSLLEVQMFPTQSWL